MKTLAAAALAFGVRVPEDELRPDVVFDEVHLCPHQHHQSLRVDDHFEVCSAVCTVDLHDFVHDTCFSRVVQRVAQSVAAALSHSNLQSQLGDRRIPQNRSFEPAALAPAGLPSTSVSQREYQRDELLRRLSHQILLSCPSMLNIARIFQSNSLLSAVDNLL